jgi:hypothetical protein
MPFKIIEMSPDDEEREIATCTNLDDAERIIAAFRAARNELSAHTLGDYGLASLACSNAVVGDRDYEWEIR